MFEAGCKEAYAGQMRKSRGLSGLSLSLSEEGRSLPQAAPLRFFLHIQAGPQPILDRQDRIKNLRPKWKNRGCSIVPRLRQDRFSQFAGCCFSAAGLLYTSEDKAFHSNRRRPLLDSTPPHQR